MSNSTSKQFPRNMGSGGRQIREYKIKEKRLLKCGPIESHTRKIVFYVTVYFIQSIMEQNIALKNVGNKTILEME